ncbi:MAG: hypothetical protein K2N38_14330 [Oscillospiraceae bacterium]|nr:hypothetical protein [Oscillospiraceae bacterium]
MTRYYFDEIDGTVDEIDPQELIKRQLAREEALAEEYEAFLEREYAQDNDEAARREEAEYWNDLERRKWELADKLLACGEE